MYKYNVTVIWGHSEKVMRTIIANSLVKAEEEAIIMAAEHGWDREFEYNGVYVSDAFDDFTFDTFKQHKQYEYFKELYAKECFNPQHVVAAACRSADHRITLVSARHWDGLMHRQSEVLGVDNHDFPIGEQGFIDQYGNYLDRIDAANIVIQNKQPLREPICGLSLYSENLY